MRLDVLNLPDAGPYVVVTVESPVPRRLTVFRSSPGGVVKLRGGKDVHIAGSGLVRDFECPLNVSCTYWAEDAAGGRVDGPETVKPAWATAWVHDADSPGMAVAVAGTLVKGALVLEDGSLDDVSRKAEGNAVGVIGSRFPVWLGGERAASENIELRLLAMTEREREILAALVDSGTTLCLRGFQDFGWELPEVAYLAARGVRLATHDRYGAAPVWSAVLSGDLVRGPSRPVIVSIDSYDQVDSAASGNTFDDADMRHKWFTYTGIDLLAGRAWA